MLMFDRKNRHLIGRSFKPIQSKITACTKVDHQLAQCWAVFYRAPDDGKFLEREQGIAYGEDGSFCGQWILLGKKSMQSSDVSLRPFGKPYVWHVGMGASGFVCASSTQVLNSSSVICRPVCL